MKTRLRRLIILLLVVVLGTGAALLTANFSTQREADLSQRVLAVLPQVAQRIVDFHRVKVDGDRKVWEVSAREAQYFDEQQLIVVMEPVVSFFMEDGRSVALRGEEGKVFLVGRDLQRVQLAGGIEVTLGDYALRTEAAQYDRSARSIVASGPVRIIGEEFDIRGDGMTVEMDAQRLIVRKNVRMTLHPEA